MNISKERAMPHDHVLRELNRSQVQFSGSLLRTVFLDQKVINRRLLPSELTSVAFLLQAVTDPSFRTRVVSALEPQDRAKLETGSCGDESLVIKEAPLEESLLKKETEILLKWVQSPSKGIPHLIKKGASLRNTLSLEEMEILALEWIRVFHKTEIPFNSKDSCIQHLKFYFFIEPFLTLFPHLVSSLDPLMEELIVSLLQFPEGEWMARVMNQFPIPVIKLFLEKLKQTETLPIKKRNHYTKVLQTLTCHMSAPEFLNLQTAYATLEGSAYVGL